MSEEWGYNLIIYLYLLGLGFSTSYLFTPNQRLRRISRNLMWGVWGVQTLMLGLWLLEMRMLVAYLDSLFIFTWALVTLYVIMSRFVKLDILLYCVQLIGFIVMISFYLFLGQASDAVEKLMLSKWIFSHVMIAVAAYAILCFSSICSVFYLVSNHLLKRRKWNHLLRRLPSLTELQRLSKQLVRIGLILMSIAIIEGVILAFPSLQYGVIADPKTWGSILVGLTYSMCLIPWGGQGWCGRRLAWWNAISILAVIGNYFVVNSSMSFHHWI